jgi:hypothetical protein
VVNSTVYELADLGVTVFPMNSHTGPIKSTMGRLLWAIRAWYAEMDNGERYSRKDAKPAEVKPTGDRKPRPSRFQVFVARFLFQQDGFCLRCPILLGDLHQVRTKAGDIGIKLVQCLNPISESFCFS